MVAGFVSGWMTLCACFCSLQLGDLFILNPPLHFVFTACIWRQPSETGIDQKRQVSGKTTNLGVEIRNFPREQN